MEVKLTYFRQDGTLRAIGRMVTITGSTDSDRVVEYVLLRSRLQHGLPGIAGPADCYHILIEVAGVEPRLVPARRLDHLDVIRPASNSATSTADLMDDD